MAVLSAPFPTHGQTGTADSKPYAKLDRGSVTYRGPDEANQNASSDGTATIGMILPLGGPAQAEGKAILAAAQIALEEEQARGPLKDGCRLTLVARDESGPWGQASSEILKLVEQDHVVVVVTSASGNTAHQADQIANKIGFPILTLSTDPTTTQANVPWLFRLGPSDTDQAHAFSQRIYQDLKLRNVLLILQTDHDGRIGGAEFEKSARELSATPPERLELATSTANLEPVSATIRATDPDAIVVWTDALLADALLPVIRNAAASTPIFLCQKAAQFSPANWGAGAFSVRSVDARQNNTDVNFEQLYRAKTGGSPGIAASEMYHAVQAAAAGLRLVGANRVLLRDYFATLAKDTDPPQFVSFDPAGNSTLQFAVVELNPGATAATAAASRP